MFILSLLIELQAPILSLVPRILRTTKGFQSLVPITQLVLKRLQTLKNIRIIKDLQHLKMIAY